jgi:hypothetical protein
MYATAVEVRFFFGKLPLHLMSAIDRQKQSLYEKLRGNPLKTVGKLSQAEVNSEGGLFTVIYALGKLDYGEEGGEIQDLWVLRIEAYASQRG